MMEKLSNSKSSSGYSVILLLVLAHSSFLFAQSDDYIGRSQFFDIAGVWQNETPVKKNCEQGRIISKIDIKPTIVNTYRVQPYIQLKADAPALQFPEWLDLNISTQTLAYTTSIAEAKSIIMPVDIFGQRKLKVFSILVDAAGNETCRQVDMFVKVNDATANMSAADKMKKLAALSGKNKEKIAPLSGKDKEKVAPLSSKDKEKVAPLSSKDKEKKKTSRGIDDIEGTGVITGRSVTLDGGKGTKKNKKTTDKEVFIDLSGDIDVPAIDLSGDMGSPASMPSPIATAPRSFTPPSDEPNLALLNFDHNDMIGSWINEWEENTFISRFRIHNNNGKRFVRLYKLLGEKEKVLGDYPVQKISQTDGALVIKFLDALYGETESTVSLRPLWTNGTMQGIDLIWEESYTNGIPYRLKRQFYVKDPDADLKNRAELKIASLEGEWLNLDPTGATYKVAVRDGDAMLWANCAEKDGGCYLGRKALEPREEDMVGSMFKMLTTYRTIDIETNLDVNDNTGEPDVIVVNMMIEDIEGLRPTVLRTEVFKRKGAIISNALYNRP